MSEGLNHDEMITELLAQWYELREQGQPLAPAELTADPDLQESLEREIASLRWFETALGVAEFAAEPPALGIPGRYERLRYHDHGGMAIIYRAYDQELDPDVAYKIMRADLARIRPIRDRFLQEARLTARLHHAGIVAVHGLISEAEGTSRPAYAMRFVEGKTLDIVARDFHANHTQHVGPADWQPVLQHIIRVALTIQYAHEQGILHRDLSPRNIVAVGDDETLVLDWVLPVVKLRWILRKEFTPERHG